MDQAGAKVFRTLVNCWIKVSEVQAMKPSKRRKQNYKHLKYKISKLVKDNHALFDVPGVHSELLEEIRKLRNGEGNGSFDHNTEIIKLLKYIITSGDHVDDHKSSKIMEILKLKSFTIDDSSSDILASDASKSLKTTPSIDLKVPPKPMQPASPKKPSGFLELMNLNEGQKAVVEGARYARGRRVYVLGPPRSGKSHLIREINKVFYQSGLEHLSLVVTPSNSAADTLARNLQTDLVQLQKSGKASKDLYVIRLHSPESEEAIRDFEGNKTRPKDPLATPEVVELEMTELERITFEAVVNAGHVKYEGIYDPRVQEKWLAAGQRMLEISGYLKTDITHPDPLKFAQWRTMYNQWATSKIPLSEDQKKQFTNLHDELYRYTLQNAAVIVGTTTGCGSREVLGLIEEHVGQVFLDDACQEREDNLWPYFAARFKKIKGFWSFGDPSGPGPYVSAPVEQYPLAVQLKIPEIIRMVNCGFEHY